MRGKRNTSITDFRNRSKAPYSRQSVKPVSTNPTTEEIDTLLRSGVRQWNQEIDTLRKRFEDPKWIILEKMNLIDLDFKGYDFNYIKFIDCKFKNCNFDENITQSMVFYKSELENCALMNINWIDPTARREKAPLLDTSSCVINNCVIEGIRNIKYWDTTDTIFSKTTINDISGQTLLWESNKFQNCEVSNLRMDKVNWGKNVFTDTNFSYLFETTQTFSLDDRFERCNFTEISDNDEEKTPFIGRYGFKPELSNFVECKFNEKAYKAFTDPKEKGYLAPKIFTDNEWYNEKGDTVVPGRKFKVDIKISTGKRTLNLGQKPAKRSLLQRITKKP